jgi:hypothetical protein
VCGPWPLGEGGTVTFLPDGKVSIEVGGPVFRELKKKVIRRFKVAPAALDFLEAAFHLPYDGQLFYLLRAIARLEDQTEFDRCFDTFCSAFCAIHELWLKRFDTSAGSRFMKAVSALATEHKRPPTKAEVTNYLCCEPPQTSEWCREHGFRWLPNERAGRKD